MAAQQRLHPLIVRDQETERIGDRQILGQESGGQAVVDRDQGWSATASYSSSANARVPAWAGQTASRPVDALAVMDISVGHLPRGTTSRRQGRRSEVHGFADPERVAAGVIIQPAGEDVGSWVGCPGVMPAE